jgi:hypothetical protein
MAVATCMGLATSAACIYVFDCAVKTALQERACINRLCFVRFQHCVGPGCHALRTAVHAVLFPQ